jgi:hypothetical protein
VSGTHLAGTPAASVLRRGMSPTCAHRLWAGASHPVPPDRCAGPPRPSPTPCCHVAPLVAFLPHWYKRRHHRRRLPFSSPALFLHAGAHVSTLPRPPFPPAQVLPPKHRRHRWELSCHRHDHRLACEHRHDRVFNQFLRALTSSFTPSNYRTSPRTLLPTTGLPPSGNDTVSTISAA